MVASRRAAERIGTRQPWIYVRKMVAARLMWTRDAWGQLKIAKEGEVGHMI